MFIFGAKIQSQQFEFSVLFQFSFHLTELWNLGTPSSNFFMGTYPITQTIYKYGSRCKAQIFVKCRLPSESRLLSDGNWLQKIFWGRAWLEPSIICFYSFLQLVARKKRELNYGLINFSAARTTATSTFRFASVLVVQVPNDLKWHVLMRFTRSRK